MSNDTHTDPLEALLRAARKDEPEALGELQTEALVARAMTAARARRRTRTVVVSGAFATLAVAAGLFLALRAAPDDVAVAPPVVATTTPRSPLPEATRAGDRLHATPNASFALADDEPRHRRVVLTRGAVLCDVRPLVDGGSFEVVADDVRVHVRGTVFSVEREATTTVRVYEGVVEIEHGAVSVRVYAGQSWARGVGVGAIDADAPLDAVGRAAAAERATAPSTATPAEAIDAEANAPATSGVPSAPAREGVTSEGATSDDPREGEDTEAPTRPMPQRLVTPSATEAEALLRHGDPSGALALAEAARGRGEGNGRWSLVRADALRALGRHAEAADAYDTAAQADARHRAEAGYAAASLRYRTLRDPAGALRSLDASGAVSSSLAERALTLRVRLLRAEGRDAEARTDATHYLERFPEGGSAPFMRDVLGTAAAETP